MNKIYIGIDPDLRLLNAAVVTDDLKLLGVLVRRNKEGKDDVAVENSMQQARHLYLDVAGFLHANHLIQSEIVLCIESQNMDRTKAERLKGNKVRAEDIRRLAQVTGCLMGAFSNLISVVHLLQPMTWKKTMTDKIVQGRALSALGIGYGIMGGNKPYCVPDAIRAPALIKHSHDKINPGDFADISDSIALAVYGAKNNL